MAEDNRFTIGGEFPVELPLYRCHKVVGAVQISAWVNHADGTIRSIVPMEVDMPEIAIPKEAQERFKRVEQFGYLVVYQDGYMSYSPQKAFEEGYTRIES